MFIFSGSENTEKPMKDAILNLSRSTIIGYHKDVVTSVAISSNNKFILSSSKDSTIRMFAAETEKQIRSFNLNNVGISCCILLPDDNLIVAGTYDDQMFVITHLVFFKTFLNHFRKLTHIKKVIDL